MERWMIVYVLPLEVWMDIFCFPWISRQKFGRCVDRIGNFKFAEHAQFYLHEWGKRTLDLAFDKYGIFKYAVNRSPVYLEFPQTPLPENIKSFVRIQIKHFDANTMDFLAKIRPLLADLWIFLSPISANHLESLGTILTNLLPSMDGIGTLHCAKNYTPPVVRQSLSRDEGFASRLKKLSIRVIYDNRREQKQIVAFIMVWLSQPENDGPRLLEFYSDHGFYEQLCSAIRMQFLDDAKTPCTFAVHWRLNWQQKGRVVAEFHLTNAIGEALHGGVIENDEHGKVVQITRHRADRRNTEEVREWITAMTKTRYERKIWIYDSTTLA